MRYYIISGEASGDLHGSNLIKALKTKDPGAEFRCWGGDLMQQAGGELVKHYRDLAFMGFVEVLANIRTITANLRFCKEDILNYKPDALILVDYPGFNLRIAEFAKKQGLKVFYYISPQIWAWKKNRVFKIKKFVDRMFVILPFEKDFYKKYDVEVDFVGHPLLDMIDQLPPKDAEKFRKENGLSEKPIIALLPGSRKQEISKMLAVMLSVVEKFPGYQFVVAGAPSMETDFYKSKLTGKDVKFIQGQTHALLQNAYAALVTSGTATLETALFGVPEVVCYKSSWISYKIAKMVIDAKTLRFISLVNLIMDREVVTELIQHDMNEKRVEEELRKIIGEEGKRPVMLKNFEELKQKLGGGGASEEVAELISGFLK